MAKNSYQDDYNPQMTSYISRDFSSLKKSLIDYTKTYFPNVYQDFNETSPGMMLLELNAYVGDILNYYVDDSFKEMILPLTEDRRNIINLSKVTGYKPRPIVPSFADITFTLSVDADTSDLSNIRPASSQFLTIESGGKLTATSNPDVFFETLEPIDFAMSASNAEDFTIDSINTETLQLVLTIPAGQEATFTPPSPPGDEIEGDLTIITSSQNLAQLYYLLKGI